MATRATKAKATPAADALTCPECGKTFTRAAALGAHRKMTHGVAGTSKNATGKRTNATASRKRRTTTTGRGRSTTAASNGAAHGSTVTRSSARSSPTASRRGKTSSRKSTPGSTKQNASPVHRKPHLDGSALAVQQLMRAPPGLGVVGAPDGVGRAAPPHSRRLASMTNYALVTPGGNHPGAVRASRRRSGGRLDHPPRWSP